MLEKYGTPMATSTTSAIHAHASARPAGERIVRAGRLPLPATRLQLARAVMWFCSSHMTMQMQMRMEERLAERPKPIGDVVE